MTLDAVKSTVNVVTLGSLPPNPMPTWSVSTSRCRDRPVLWRSSGLCQARVAVRMALVPQRRAAAFNLEGKT